MSKLKLASLAKHYNSLMPTAPLLQTLTYLFVKVSCTVYSTSKALIMGQMAK